MPNSVLGLAIGAARYCCGARAVWSPREHAVVFDAWRWGPGGAMTLGTVILLNGASLDLQCSTYGHAADRCEHPPAGLGDHERAHVDQYMLLGPLFVPVYFLCGGIPVRNPLERAADADAMHGHGWWPWGFQRRREKPNTSDNG
ncbi:hypothetical protein [Xanthomonas oryzae]|uniref:hypothetical protein n=1 Tax=Xanthomonas oryzae TaxID=347 RepID=UPI001E45176D|nr:hypothetical protein [Xanthomonas oryzae]WDN32192.1 hypothetical protein LL916_17120 [Xanthomonas oryzae]WDN35647.1 hypothetical protein LL918_00315 [Xanthomonas oryzae]WEE92296.1 hypothetical protein MJJ09_09725 [Xanthomonas oryzae]